MFYFPIVTDSFHYCREVIFLPKNGTLHMDKIFRTKYSSQKEDFDRNIWGIRCQRA